MFRKFGVMFSALFATITAKSLSRKKRKIATFNLGNLGREQQNIREMSNLTKNRVNYSLRAFIMNR